MKKTISKTMAWLLSVVMMLALVSAGVMTVNASDDYPYSGTAPGVYIVDDWNFYRGECTSFCAWRLNNNNGVAFHNYYGGVHWGNANNWDDAARSLGYTVDNTPAVGAIAYWEGDAGSFGHVAWVSNVYDGSVDIEEYNYGYVVINGEYHGSHKYNSRNISKWDPSGYIHIQDINPVPAEPWFYASKSVSVSGDSVSFYFGQDNAISYCIGIDRDGKRIITENMVTSGKTYTFDAEGTYSAYVTCYSNSGYVDSPRAEFKVFKPCNMGEDFYAKIRHPKSGAHVVGDSRDNVSINYYGSNKNDEWHFQRNTDGSYRITNVGLQKCMDVNGGTADFGENIQVWPANDSDAQRWYIRHLPTGFAFVPKCNTSSAIDITGGVFESGTNIQDYRSNETTAQIFNIDYIDLKPAITKEYNGHHYEFYNISTTWDQANKICNERGGHLVTISSKEENDFVLNLSKEAGSDLLIWLGGYADENRNWSWVTDESFSYTNWYPGQPDNNGNGTSEDYLNMKESGMWNDIAIHGESYMFSFVCEYEGTDVDADQYIPVRTGMLNDSKYELYTSPVTWKRAKAICEAKGGHLVIINNSEENTYVSSFAQTDIWMGITDRQNENQWLDTSGSTIKYSNWVEGEPNDHLMCEDYGELYQNGTWNDHKNYQKLAFVCEYEPTIKLSKTSVFLVVGSSETITATITPENYVTPIRWKSSDTNVATVENGKITAIAKGSSIVTATSENGLVTSCIVIVSDIITGDLNGDGTADIADALMAARYDAGMLTLNSKQLVSGDVNRDNSVDIADALMIARYDAGIAEFR